MRKNIKLSIMAVFFVIALFFTYVKATKPENVELDEVKLKDEIKIDKSKTLAVYRIRK